MSPYRTRDNRIQGVVITLGNISALKVGEARTEEARAYAEAIVDTVIEPLVVLDAMTGQVVSAGRSFYEYFETSPEETIGRLLPDTDAHHLDVPALRAFLERLKDENDLQSAEIEIELPSPRGRRVFTVNCNRVRHGTERQWLLVSLLDVTDHRRSEGQLAAAREEAEQANQAKSRFLAAVSHDLRQPLQTLMFLHDSLRPQTGRDGESLLARADETLASMSNMLNALLDINQLESGNIVPERADFPIDHLLGRLDSEFGLHARAKGLEWRTVRSRHSVRSDPRLLEQMLRNLLSNAIRYTEKGGVLLGCRRHGDHLFVEVWDTGIGIAEEDIPRIFGEYRRAAGPAEDAALGLGLAIVARLGELLDHPVSVRSRLGRGSVFAVEVPLSSGGQRPRVRRPRPAPESGARRSGTVLVIDDDPSVREALQSILAREGHHVAAVGDGNAAVALVAESEFAPDLIVSDYMLPGGMTGAKTVEALRQSLGREVPAIFLTGDVRHATLRGLRIAASVVLAKPVRREVLSQTIQRFLADLPADRRVAAATASSAGAAIFVVDDDRGVRESMRELLSGAGYRVEAFATGEALLAADRSAASGCLIIDVRMPGISGFELLARLAASGNTLPTIMVTGHGDIAMAVRAMRAGAADFIEKPVGGKQLLGAIDRALRLAADPAGRSEASAASALRIAGLTNREREVMDLVVSGHQNKVIAARLGISQRTVETHRASMMQKMGVASLSDLVRAVLIAETQKS